MPATSSTGTRLWNRLERRGPQALGKARPSDGNLSTWTPLRVAADILVSALWFGAATGLAEVAVLCGWHMVQGEAVLGALQLNRHFPWMIPLAYLGIYACSAIPLMFLALLWPRRAARLGVAVPLFLTTFALLSLCKGLYPLAKVVLSTALAYRLSHRIVGHEIAYRRIRSLSLVPVFGALAGLGIWSYDQEVLQENRILQGLPDTKPGAKNVLLIVLDTVAADHLSLYGYQRDTTPRLRDLARSGVVFDMARSPASWTLPAHASIFTARWPNELNVGEHRPLDDTYPTLAEYLAHHGYATSGFIGNTYYCNSWFGLARGFQHYEDYYEENVLVSPSEALRCSTLGRALIRQFGAAYNVRPEVTNTPKDARRINHDFLKWLDQHNDRPFFTFLNYLDAHDPYLTPPGSNRHFGRVPSTEEEIRTLHHWSKFIHEHAADIDHLPPAHEIELVHDAYDDCLFALDEQIGHLMDELRSRGVLEKTLVILTADHGEALGEHGLFGHGMSLYRPEIHVPLLVLDPSGTGAGQRVSTPVSPRDIAATVVDALDLALDSPFPGNSLVPLWRRPDSANVRPDTSVTSVVQILKKPIPQPRPHCAPAYNGTLTSLVIDDKVYLRDSFGREELYDLNSDPSESNNLAGLAEMEPLLKRGRAAFDRLWTSER